MLDVFSCTGGFGVHAAAGGAKEVHSVDISAQAIRNVEANMALNATLNPRVAACRHSTSVGDAFEVVDAPPPARRFGGEAPESDALSIPHRPVPRPSRDITFPRLYMTPDDTLSHALSAAHRRADRVHIT